MDIEIEHKILIHVRNRAENEALIKLMQKFDIEIIWRNWNNWSIPYGKTYEIPEKTNPKFLIQLKKINDHNN